MGRTQVYLTDEELELLADAAEKTGATRSELVRRAVRATYKRPPSTPEERAEAVRATAGIWKDRPFTTEEYLATHRTKLDDRLRTLGFE